ncbi:MAG: serine acetyltransferase [Bacteroidales bacterium]|nr:serine acetyltransferase [Bacteroidales bacterium]
MTFKETKGLIRSDYYRLRESFSFHMFIKDLIFNSSFKTTFWLRIGNYLNSKRNIVAKMLKLLVELKMWRNTNRTGIQIKIGTEIGPGLNIHHISGIIMSPEVKVGKNFTIYQGVTVGRVHNGKKAGVPTVGDNVTAFAGSKILGNIKIGNNVIIGANAVVLSDVPDNVTVGGIPAKIISQNHN